MGWIIAAVLSPFILLIAVLCSLGSGSAAHNNFAVDACFYGGSFSEQVPAEYQTHVMQMRSAFSVLDTSIAAVNAIMENGSLDPTRIKAVFYALCFGENAPSQRAANRFVECFYTTEERTQEVTVLDENGDPVLDEDGNPVTESKSHTVALPCSLETAYANLAAELGREITGDDRKNIAQIYRRIAGSVDSGVYGITDFERGTDHGVEIDLAGYVDPSRKNAADLATYAIHAWEQGWGYVWGTCGWVLTDELLEAKLAQYPEGVGQYENVIRDQWLCRERDAGLRSQSDVLRGHGDRHHRHDPGGSRPRRLAGRTHRRVHRRRLRHRSDGHPLRRGQNEARRAGLHPLAGDPIHRL